MATNDIALMAHLMRRAGFGAPRPELEARAAAGYEATVEELLAPDEQEPVDILEFLRYHPSHWKPGTLGGVGQTSWVYRMIVTDAPLQEKMTLFWHQIFATGVSKVDHYHEVTTMVDMFREMGMGKFRDIVTEVAKNPAMIYWLDNHENHSYAVNENWGRELLELFSMGVGNYTEEDVFEASRAFTGWTITPVLPRFTMGRFDWEFEYRDHDHDHSEKTFLGRKGNFNGYDVIEIILEHPQCSKFIARHLYNFFVADEPQVPAWNDTPPRDPEAVETIAAALRESDYDMRHALRVLLNSEFFKDARFARVKSPAEAVIGALRLAGGTEFPGPFMVDYAEAITNMGQELLNPPSVEGWHTGVEWINTGSAVKRINFFAEVLGDLARPGMREMVDRLKSRGELSPAELVDGCLDLMGPVGVTDDTYRELVDHAAQSGPLDWRGNGASETRFSEMVQLIASTRDYQFA